MIKILFICHGNICRSPMAQFVFQNMVNTAGYGDEFHIESKATSTEEIGNPPHRQTVRKLKEEGVPVLTHHAVQMRRQDYGQFDYIIGMDSWNYKNMMRILGDDAEGKVSLLLDFTDHPRDIADPWYTGDFDKTYADISEGCEALLHKLLLEGKVG